MVSEIGCVLTGAQLQVVVAKPAAEFLEGPFPDQRRLRGRPLQPHPKFQQVLKGHRALPAGGPGNVSQLRNIVGKGGPNLDQLSDQGWPSL